MPNTLPPLIADSTLGKLVKQLRLAGMDVLFDRAIPAAHRLESLSAGRRTILTRCQKVQRLLHHKPLIYVRHDQPLAQIRQVISGLGVQRTDLNPLSRCSRCNDLLETISKSEIAAAVPDYVWQIHEQFKRCPSCHRIYWPGSHAERWAGQLDRWFGSTA